MISDKSKVLAAVAIADKIDTLSHRKAECVKWFQADDASEESKKFWTDALESINRDIQEYSDARYEMINN